MHPPCPSPAENCGESRNVASIVQREGQNARMVVSWLVPNEKATSPPHLRKKSLSPPRKKKTSESDNTTNLPLPPPLVRTDSTQSLRSFTSNSNSDDGGGVWHVVSKRKKKRVSRDKSRQQQRKPNRGNEGKTFGRVKSNVVRNKSSTEKSNKQNSRKVQNVDIENVEVEKEGEGNDKNAVEVIRDRCMTKSSEKEKKDNAKLDSKSKKPDNLRQRLWSQLFRNVRSSIDDLYHMIEFVSSAQKCEEGVNVLHHAVEDLKLLQQRINDFSKAKASGGNAPVVFQSRTPLKGLAESRDDRTAAIVRRLQKLEAIYEMEHPHLAEKERSTSASREILVANDSDGEGADFLFADIDSSSSKTNKFSPPRLTSKVMNISLTATPVKAKSSPHRNLVVKTSSIRTPKGSHRLHEKLSSPDRRKLSGPEIWRRYREREARAEENRSALDRNRRVQHECHKERIRKVQDRNEEKYLTMKNDLDDRLRRASERKVAAIESKRDRAHRESSKVEGVREELEFMEKMTAPNRKAELERRLLEAQARKDANVQAIVDKQKHLNKAEEAEQRRAILTKAQLDRAKRKKEHHKVVNARRNALRQSPQRSQWRSTTLSRTAAQVKNESSVGTRRDIVIPTIETSTDSTSGKDGKDTGKRKDKENIVEEVTPMISPITPGSLASIPEDSEMLELHDGAESPTRFSPPLMSVGRRSYTPPTPHTESDAFVQAAADRKLRRLQRLAMFQSQARTKKKKSTAGAITVSNDSKSSSSFSPSKFNAKSRIKHGRVLSANAPAFVPSFDVINGGAVDAEEKEGNPKKKRRRRKKKKKKKKKQEISIVEGTVTTSSSHARSGMNPSESNPPTGMQTVRSNTNRKRARILRASMEADETSFESHAGDDGVEWTAEQAAKAPHGDVIGELATRLSHLAPPAPKRSATHTTQPELLRTLEQCFVLLKDPNELDIIALLHTGGLQSLLSLVNRTLASYVPEVAHAALLCIGFACKSRHTRAWFLQATSKTFDLIDLLSWQFIDVNSNLGIKEELLHILQLVLSLGSGDGPKSAPALRDRRVRFRQKLIQYVFHAGTILRMSQSLIQTKGLAKLKPETVKNTRCAVGISGVLPECPRRKKKVRGQTNNDETSLRLVKNCLRFLDSVTDVTLSSEAEVISANSFSILTEQMRATSCAGVVTLLLSLFVKVGTFSGGGRPRNAGVTVEKDRALTTVAADALKVLSNVAKQNLEVLQLVLGGEVQREFLHLTSLLLDFIAEQEEHIERASEGNESAESPLSEQGELEGKGNGSSSFDNRKKSKRYLGRQQHEVDALLEALLVCLGFFCLGNSKNQEALHWGLHPTPLQRLCCGLPERYYTIPHFVGILFPTLLAAVYKNKRALSVVKEEMDSSILRDFLDGAIRKRAASFRKKGKEIREKGRSSELKRKLSSWKYVARRLPAKEWESILEFIQNS